ncbi:MAG: tetratricopeptide repeat protein [Ignavibacteriales bacterium]|nr:tetratricopeptide repeat protein [Ignavibacteriales bacterium]
MQKIISSVELAAILILFIVFLSTGCKQQVDDGKVAITTSSTNAKDDFIKGRDLFEKLRQRESLKYFEDAIAKDNKFAMAYYYHSLANPTTKGFFEDLDNAVENSESASEGEKLIILALKAGVDGNQKLQEEHLTKLVELFPKDERAHGLLGQFYFGQQEYEMAVEHLKKSTEITPNYTSSYNMLGYSYRNLENYTEAEKAFKKYIELIPDDPNPYDSYAEMLSKQGRYEESIKQYKKALEINSDFFNSKMGISNNLIYMNKYDEAIDNCDKSFTDAKNNGEKRFAIFTKVIAYVDEGNTNAALDEMQKQFDIAKSINDVGNMSGDLNAVGNILFEAQKFDEAKAKFTQALSVIENSNLSDEVKENNRRLNLYNLGRVALMTGNINEAKDFAAKFSKSTMEANNTFQMWLAHSFNGLIALHETDYKKAIGEFEKSSMQNPQTIYYLAVAYAKDGNKMEAKKYAEKCANFNALINLNQAFVRNKAKEMLTTL